MFSHPPGLKPGAKFVFPYRGIGEIDFTTFDLQY